ncbi:MFS transporter [Haloglomus irregulare]|jgi:MFS family permease|uniref:MFS transporter n=1 Tax=Haloglomus irregulare TaxID=2234134 RepID=A0A554MUU4_9EURY|nr:MFS transporter [Haloglomus irregulare]TSD08928.1 MFS transporter [Haloglomus irregulare]
MVLGTDRRVLALAMARMADALGNSFLIIVLPLYIASGQVAIDGIVGGRLLGFTLTEEFLIGLVLSLFGFLNSFGQPVTGRISDRVGTRKPFILGGLVVFGVASAAYPFVSSYAAILVVRAVQGLGAALTVPATIALVNDYATSDDERGGNFGVFNTFRLIGFGFGPIVAGIVVAGGFGRETVTEYVLGGLTLSGFNAAFAIAVLGAVVSFALVVWLVDEPPRAGADAADDLSISVLDPDGGIDTVFAVGIGTLFMALTIALFATLQEPINTALGQGSTLFGLQFSAVVAANVLLQVPIGNWADEYGRRPFIIAGFALLAPSVLAQGLIPLVTTPGTLVGPGLMLASRLVQGVAVAMVFAPGLAVAGDLARDGRSGTTLSVLTMAFGLGVAFGPLVSGFLFSFGLLAPFAFGAGLAVVALVLTVTQVEETLGGGSPTPEADDPPAVAQD